jgi:hypothetical protein
MVSARSIIREGLALFDFILYVLNRMASAAGGGAKALNPGDKAAAELLNIKKEPAEVVSNNVETICKKHGIGKGDLLVGLGNLSKIYSSGLLGDRLQNLRVAIAALKGGRRRTQKNQRRQRKQKNRRSRKN